jgi:hypothetical protein
MQPGARRVPGFIAGSNDLHMSVYLTPMRKRPYSYKRLAILRGLCAFGPCVYRRFMG